MYLNWIQSKIVAKEALDRNSWILDADLCFRWKSHQNRIFWNVKAIPVSIWNDFTPNVATEALDRSSWILDADHSVQSHLKIVFFWNVKSYSCIYLKWILFQKCGYSGIRQTLCWSVLVFWNVHLGIYNWNKNRFQN